MQENKQEIRKLSPLKKMVKNLPSKLASVAQSDEHQTGDQEVAGSIPMGLTTFFSWRLIMKYFLWSFSSFC